MSQGARTGKRWRKKMWLNTRNWRKELGAEGWVLMYIDVHVRTAITMWSFYAIWKKTHVSAPVVDVSCFWARCLTSSTQTNRDITIAWYKMETFEKNLQLHGTNIQSLSKNNFGYRVCHITPNWIIFHKLSDKITV